MQPTLRPHFGTHVTGPGYWEGTEPNADLIAARLARGESLKCFGLRRIGKSSLLAETRRRLDGRKHTTIWLDGQRIKSITGLLNAMMQALRDDAGLGHRITALFEQTTLLPPAVKARLQEMLVTRSAGATDDQLDIYAETLFEETGRLIGKMPPGKRPIVFFDELPRFCQSVVDGTAPGDQPRTVNRLNQLLATLRTWRGEDTGVAMALGGSMAMARLERTHRIDCENINDCPLTQVVPMNAGAAQAMVRAMIAHVKPEGWDPGIPPALINLLPALYPGVVQFAFNRIRDRSPLTLDGLEKAYRDDIAPGLEEDYYRQFDNRLSHYERDERLIIAGLLDAVLAAQGEILPWDQALALCGGDGGARLPRELLNHLQDDNFLVVRRDAGVRFSSGLVRVWHAGGTR